MLCLRAIVAVWALVVLSPSRLEAQSWENEDKPKEDREARQEWFMSMRRGSDGTIPQNALITAKEQAQQMPRPLGKGVAAMDAGISSWEWLGPGNVGGRIRAILVHPTTPSTIWIGAASGGIWKTTDGGASWFPLNDFLPSLAVTSLVMDPTNSNVIYAATGEGFDGSSSAWPGAGVFRSADGGATWTQLSDTQNWRWTTRIAHHPSQSGILLAAVNDDTQFGNRIYRTTNSGQTWTTDVVGIDKHWVDVKFSPFNGNEALAATNGGEVFRSSDGGQSFSVLTCVTNGLCIGATRAEVAFGPVGYRYVSSNTSYGQVWRSTNSGVDWELRNTGSYYMGAPPGGSVGNYANMLWVDPTNGEHILVGGIDIYRSTNGGTTLARISAWDQFHFGLSAHGDQHVAVSDPGYNGSTNKKVYFGNDGGIQMATDLTTASLTSGWTNLANNLGITQFYGGATNAGGTFFIGGTQDNSHVTLGAGGGTDGWVQKFPGDGGFAAIDPTNANVQYGENQFLNVFKTLDGGVSYIRARKGLADTTNTSAPFVAPLVMDPNNPQKLLAGSYRIWKTTDGAANWTILRSAVSGNPWVTAIDIAEGDSNVIWVGYADGKLYKSLNAGANWSWEGLVTPSGRAVTDIAIDPSNHNNVWVTYGGYATSNVWYTDAGSTPGGVPGTHWFNRTGSPPYQLPEVHVATVRVHPGNSDWVYVGTDIGLFASDDRGVSWNRDPYPYGLGTEGPAYTQVAELFWQGEHLIAATHGRGMFRVRPGLVVWVDPAALPEGDGSFLKPFREIADATSALGNGSVLHVKTGTYRSPVVMDKATKVQLSNGPVVVQ